MTYSRQNAKNRSEIHSNYAHKNRNNLVDLVRHKGRRAVFKAIGTTEKHVGLVDLRREADPLLEK